MINLPAVKDVKDLKPIVDKTIKTLYGEDVEDLKIRSATQCPLLWDEKTFWSVTADFLRRNYEYTVDLYVQISDGTVTSARETWRKALPKGLEKLKV